jgi:predicted TIM-barrel fold metal-dependent hydrolase
MTRNRIIVTAVQAWLAQNEEKDWPETLKAHFRNPAPELTEDTLDFQAWRSAPAMQKAMPQSPLEMARGFYYDTLVYEPALLRFLVELFGADRIFIGTDYPFPIRQVDPAAFLRDCGLAEGAMDAMMGGNALRFLGVNA